MQADARVWRQQVGTLGMPTDALDDERKLEIASRLEDDHDSLVVFPADSDFDGHYSHYCKTMLWPVLHYQIPDNPKSKAYQDHSWVYYVNVNQAFADRIVGSYKKGDVIWIHDYHLFLVPSMVRRKLPEAEIGFYLHVAFPSSEVFRCLAMRRELLEGVLGANLIGFQTQEYCRHFLQTCNWLLCVEATPGGVQLEDRFVNVATFPMGVDLAELDLRRQDAGVLDWVARMRSKYHDKHLIVARDKLDHVRGVRQKLLSYELFLSKYPEHRERVVLIQIATSTTEQAELDAAVGDIVTRINSRYSTLAHQPLVFLKQDMEYSQYLAMLTAADALMITSLREGMNLTSHEFLLCQDGRHAAGGGKKHGSLILSEFTGSASLFGGRELSVNPWDYRQCAEAVRKTLEMGAAEKAARWAGLMDAVRANSGGRWYEGFLGALRAAWQQHARQHTGSIPRLSLQRLAERYRGAERRLLMLDYEGTLAPREGPRGALAFGSPQRTLDALNALLADGRNIVYVMSGQRPEELDRLFQRVPGLGLIAENGCFLRDPDREAWHEVADVQRTAAWKDSIMSVLRYHQDRAEGSTIEERHCSLLFHYRDAKDPAAAARQAGDCANHINESCQSLRVAGDSRDDEGIYRWANRLAADGVVRDVTTVSLSSRNTEAMATLSQGVTGVLSMLHKLAALA